ncbi:MAG: putative molybdenum carrier protein [Desulfobacterales bacterium]|nr:putative molybdenum carrier protein [Desulfobacterales bacterium]
MKSIVQMAKDQDISSSTIREYISRFEQFFPDPVEREGVKEYPPEAEDLIQKIYGYYQNSGMTKQEIRAKLEGSASAEPAPGAAVATAVSPLDMDMVRELNAKFDRMIVAIENLTAAITGADVGTFKGIQKQAGSHRKISKLNEQLSEVIELSKEEGAGNESVEKNVLEADGTVVFSFGKLAPNARDSINFAKAHKKPWLHIDLEIEKNPSAVLRKWLPQFEIKVLNVAGRSASKIPGLKRSINDIISLVLKG